MYSSAIVIESSNLVDNIPQKFIIHGAGWGHGVGLCQVGAAVMAEKGYKFEAILAHYYQGAIIEKLFIKRIECQKQKIQITGKPGHGFRVFTLQRGYPMLL